MSVSTACLVFHVVLACHLAVWPKIQDISSNFCGIFDIRININPIYGSSCQKSFLCVLYFMCKYPRTLCCNAAVTTILLLFTNYTISHCHVISKQPIRLYFFFNFGFGWWPVIYHIFCQCISVLLTCVACLISAAIIHIMFVCECFNHIDIQAHAFYFFVFDFSVVMPG